MKTNASYSSEYTIQYLYSLPIMNQRGDFLFLSPPKIDTFSNCQFSIIKLNYIKDYGREIFFYKQK